MSTFNPGPGPYNNPETTISNPLAPVPQQFSNFSTLINGQGKVVGVMVFRNGILLTEGLDYRRSGGVVMLLVPPTAGDVMTAQVFAIGKQLGGATQERYVAPWTLPLTGPFDGVGTLYRISWGPTISGVCNSVNNVFTVDVACARWQVWRNGILQTQNQDFVAGPSTFVFLPLSLPQAGDIITALGFNSC